MDYNSIDVVTNKLSLTLYKEKVNKLLNLFNDNFIYNLSNEKWKSLAKDNFVDSIKMFNDELVLFSNLLLKANNTMDEIKQIQELTNKINELQQENELLKNSTQVSNKLKMQENENNINANEQLIKKIKNKIFQEWG